MKKTVLGTTMLLLMAIGVSAFTTSRTEACCTENGCTMENCDKTGCEGCCDEAGSCCKDDASCCAGAC